MRVKKSNKHFNVYMRHTHTHTQCFRNTRRHFRGFLYACEQGRVRINMVLTRFVRKLWRIVFWKEKESMWSVNPSRGKCSRTNLKFQHHRLLFWQQEIAKKGKLDLLFSGFRTVHCASQKCQEREELTEFRKWSVDCHVFSCLSDTVLHLLLVVQEGTHFRNLR